MAFASIGGLTLHYQLSGPAGAPPLVFANSLGCDLRIWDEVVAKLGDRYRVLRYDKRGHGLSDAPPAPYTLDDHAGDLLGLLDHLGLARVALAGISVGGLVAQRLALRAPERLAALALCDTAAKIGNDALWAERIAAVEGEGIAAISAAVLGRWFTADFPRLRPAEFAGWRNMLERSPAAGYAGTCAALRDADLRAEIGAIAIDTLVVVGEADLSTPPELVRETARLLPRARFHVLPGCGHLPPLEQPALLAAILTTYLEELGHV